MLKKVIDTNIFIDRLADQSRFEDLFLTSGQVYMSSVVLIHYSQPQASPELRSDFSDEKNNSTKHVSHP
jgi:predicted nucleic acid-binding protein